MNYEASGGLITVQDFMNAMVSTGLDEKVFRNMLQRFRAAENTWYDWIGRSFLPSEMKAGYIAMIHKRLNRLRVEH